MWYCGVPAACIKQHFLAEGRGDGVGGGGGQASVNPKAETVEELQARRKNLHLGMCKLLREDLALKAEAKLAGSFASQDVRSRIRKQITADFDSQTQRHQDVGVALFNDNAVYKRLMSEAIDGTTYAIQKIGVYLESVAGAIGQSELDIILYAPLADFASRATVLRLRTGIAEFPWVEVVEERRADIQLGDWDAASASPQALELVASALGGNANVRSVTVNGVKLVLSEGWTTDWLDWACHAAVMALPATAAMVLRNCGSLTRLDLRCDGRDVGCMNCTASRR